VVIAATSEGTIVVNRELAYLTTDPSAPRVRPVVIRSVFEPRVRTGPHLSADRDNHSGINYTARDLADSQYDVSVVFHQYDAWADPPDRPWSPLSVVNSLFGTLYFHNNIALSAGRRASRGSPMTSGPPAANTASSEASARDAA
jgi:hypothetical protein